MRLVGDIEICFEGHVITEKELQHDRVEWYGKTPALVMWQGDFDTTRKARALHAMLYDDTPVTVEADTSAGPLRLKASIEVFPIPDPENKYFFNTYSLRLVPTQGKLRSVKFNDKNIAIDNLTTDPQSTKVDFGNGTLHFEIFNQPTNEIPKLPPSPLRLS